MGPSRGLSVLLNPFCALSTAKVIALKPILLLLLTLLIKAKIRITGFSALGFCLLLLQTLVFLAIGAGLVVAAGGAALYAMQQLRQAAARAPGRSPRRFPATAVPPCAGDLHHQVQAALFGVTAHPHQPRARCQLRRRPRSRWRTRSQLMPWIRPMPVRLIAIDAIAESSAPSPAAPAAADPRAVPGGRCSEGGTRAKTPCTAIMFSFLGDFASPKKDSGDYQQHPFQPHRNQSGTIGSVLRLSNHYIRP